MNIYDTILHAGTARTSQHNYGMLPYVLNLLCTIIWPFSWIYCNEHRISFADSTMARGIVSIVLSYSVCWSQQSPALGLGFRGNFRLLALRSVFMCIQSFMTGLAQFVLPLPLVHTIGCSGVLAVFAIDYWLNGVAVNSHQVVGIAVGVLGVLLMCNGKLAMGYIDPEFQERSNYQNYLITDSVSVSIFTFFYCLSLILWAYATVQTKMAKANTFQINFMLGLAFLFLGNLIKPFMTDLGYKQLSFDQLWKTILTLGLPAFLVNLLGITALTMTKQTGLLNLLNFAMIAVSYFISIFRYGENLNPVSTLGVILVVAGVTKAVLNKSSS